MKMLDRYDLNCISCYCTDEDVQELEAQYAAACKHMMRMYYALCGLTNPQPDDVYDELMDEAKRAIEAFCNDEPPVTVEIPYTDEEQDNE